MRPLGRTTPASRTLLLPAVTLLAATLVGCGADDSTGDSATDAASASSSAATAAPSTSAPATSATPSGTPSATPSGTSSEPAPSASVSPGEEATQVAIVTRTAVGGTVSPIAVPLGDRGEVRRFSTQFTAQRMLARLGQVVDRTDVPAGQELYGAVVAVGCQAPTGVSVELDGTQVLITADPVTATPRQCLAPMTSVALVLVPADR